jgi:hypothetical protein
VAAPVAADLAQAIVYGNANRLLNPLPSLHAEDAPRPEQAFAATRAGGGSGDAEISRGR